MRKKYSIAVIGESGSGKSTWISSCYREEIAKELKKNCELNKEGQTKVAVYYSLGEPNIPQLRIQSLTFHLEQLKELRHDDIVQRLFEELQCKDILEAEGENGEWEKKVEDYFCSERFQEDISSLHAGEFIEEYVNNKEIAQKEILSHVDIIGPASEEVWEIMQEYGLTTVTFQDTRGFLDDTPKKITEYLERCQKDTEAGESRVGAETEQADADFLNYLLNERGITQVDACMLLSKAGANSLNKENYRRFYGPLIKSMLINYPTSLVVRTSEIISAIKNHSEITYDQAISEENGEYKYIEFFTGFDSLRELLRDFGLNPEEATDVKTKLAQQNYKELMWADVPKTHFNNPKVMSIYKKTVLGVFRNVLEGIDNYYKDIDAAKKFREEFNMDYSKDAKQIFDNLFDTSLYYYNPKWGYCSRMFKYVTKSLAEEVKRACKCYYGGFVGVRGGLSAPARGEEKRWAAIDFLETGYQIREKIIESLPEKILGDKNIGEKIVDKYGLEFLEELKNKLAKELQNIVRTESECLSFTRNMILRKYLRNAFDKTVEDMEITETYIGRYLVEYQSMPKNLTCSNELLKQWNDDRHHISVCKYLLWNLIEESMLGMK